MMMMRTSVVEHPANARELYAAVAGAGDGGGTT
jgi:hypothetical protein